MKNFQLTFFVFTALLLHSLNAQQPASPLEASYLEFQKMKSNTEYNLQWQSLGPVINSARVEAVQVDPRDPATMYAAFGSGNLWKTTDNGLCWTPIFNDVPVLGIGDFALAPSNPDIIYVGTGESLKKARNFTMPGNGVYRSEDGGLSWVHVGLDDTWHIGEIVVHPTIPDIVVVATMGHFWSRNKNRGIYLTTNGGKSWDQVLYVDEKTGANDIVISPSDPNIMYASMWENNPGVNGNNSSVYVSDDGGKTWKKKVSGFPQGIDVGRIGLAVSYSNPDKVYAMVDNRGKESKAEIYASTNRGDSWSRSHIDDLDVLSVIGWYFTDIYVNPKDDEEIYALGVRIAHSTDGGKNFEYIEGDVHHFFPSPAQTLHLDHCEMWINPNDPDHIIVGNDGGLYISHNKGDTWMHYNNIPTGEFYDITIDNKKPYTIYGGTQDNATVYGPGKEWNPGNDDEWDYLWIDAWSGGDGCITQVDPKDQNIVYFSAQNGAVRKRNITTGKSKYIRPEFPKEDPRELNYNFVTPYIISPHDASTLYHASNYVFKSVDKGEHWDLISEDLSVSSVNHKRSVAAGAFAESPMHKGHLYLGTDRGAFWISTNDGKSWEERSEGLPDHYIRSIVPSIYDPSTIYVALSGLNYDNYGCHLYISEDHGSSWRSINGNLPNETSYVIKEDPLNQDILYAGLYRGAYISIDRGSTWSILGSNLPTCAVADIEIDKATKDLVIATHGRGIYKLNLNPIHNFLSMNTTGGSNHLFEIPSVKRPRINDTHREPIHSTGEKAVITYLSGNDQEVLLNLTTNSDSLLWSAPWKVKKGINQMRWNLVYKSEKSMKPYFIHYDHYLEKGTYKVEIKSVDNTLKVELEVLNNN